MQPANTTNTANTTNITNNSTRGRTVPSFRAMQTIYGGRG
jgi:hypothetical protein